MNSSKQSRVARLEKTLAELIKHIADQDQAIRWILKKIEPEKEEKE